MRKSPKKLTLTRETLHVLEVKQAQGGTYTGDLKGCARTLGAACTGDSYCVTCNA
jgi:hypothetical protein